MLTCLAKPFLKFLFPRTSKQSSCQRKTLRSHLSVALDSFLFLFLFCHIDKPFSGPGGSCPSRTFCTWPTRKCAVSPSDRVRRRGAHSRVSLQSAEGSQEDVWGEDACEDDRRHPDGPAAAHAALHPLLQLPAQRGCPDPAEDRRGPRLQGVC